MRASRRPVGDPHRRCALAGARGVTLLEVLFASGVGLLAVAAFMSLNVAQLYAMRGQSSQVELQTAARTIADLFTREVRRAGSGIAIDCATSRGVLSAGPTTLRVRAELDGAAGFTGPNEDVTYEIDVASNRITRTDRGTREVLWAGASVGSSRLSYLDKDGTVIVPSGTELSAAQLLAIRRIRLRLDLTEHVPQPRNTLVQTALEVTDVELRNRYFATPACPG